MEVDHLYPQTAVVAATAAYDNRSMLSQDLTKHQSSRTSPGSTTSLSSTAIGSTAFTSSSTSSSTPSKDTEPSELHRGSGSVLTAAAEQEVVRSSTVSELLKNAVRGSSTSGSNTNGSSTSGSNTTTKQPVKSQVLAKPPSKNEFELKIHSDGKVLKVQKSRQRKIHSCIYCHLKKIKCSRVQPTCNHCEKLGLECKYFANERVSRGGTNLNPNGTSSNGMSGETNNRGEEFMSASDSQQLQQSPLTIKRSLSPRMSPNPNKNRCIIKQEVQDDVPANVAPFPTSPSPILDGTSIISPPLPPPKSNGGKNSASSHSHASSSSGGNNNRPPPPPIPLASARLVMSAMSSPLDFPIFDQNQSNNNANSNSNQNITFNNALLSGISPGPGITTPTNSQANYLLQTPIINNVSNNITNSFFNNGNANPNNSNNTNINSNSNNPAINPNYNNPPTGVSNFGEEQYSFNLLSFTFKNEIKNSNNGATGKTDSSNPNIITSNQQSMNLNPYLSNPATTINYLYGTNTYYDNDHLLEDLENHLPISRERSHELIERYINSVHILLPILINLDDFVAQHEFYWNIRTRNAGSSNSSPNDPSPQENNDGTETNNSNGSASNSGSANGSFANQSAPSTTSSSSTSQPDFNYLQFYTLYFPVLYASTISEFEEYDNLLLNQDINKYLKAFNKICQYYNYPHGIKILPLLLGNVIIQSTSPNPSTMEMSQIIRYAKFLQMHKDPVLTLRITDWEVIKFRRLLWWVIFGLDALTSHNFCLPPVCQFNDFNVLMPDEVEPVFSELNKDQIIEKRLNIAVMSMNIKFKYDRILSDLVYQLHNGLSTDITSAKVTEIKSMILELFKDINNSMHRLNNFIKQNPPQTVQEMNLINFVKNHSWSFVDRATMLLHKKILMGDVKKGDNFSPYALAMNTSASISSNASQGKSSTESPTKGSHSEGLVSYRSYSFGQEGIVSTLSHKTRGGVLSLSQYEDTFGKIQEANIVSNFHNLSISQLKFSQFENFTYDNLNNNLIPSILHNLNDFLKYNDFIKFGKFNWYVKRTIPLDSIILMFIIIIVKFKYEFITVNELIVYVKLINKALFILIRKWFKNEKYKRMLSLTNLAWDYILKKYNIINIVNQYIDKFGGEDESKVEYFDYEMTKFVNLNDLFSIMDVPLPILPDDIPYKLVNGNNYHHMNSQVSFGGSNSSKSQNGNWQSITMSPASTQGSNGSTNEMIEIHTKKHMPNALITREDTHITKDVKLEVMQLNEKIYYDLRNNFVDINDYCAFYSSLENILHALMDYINCDS